MLRKIALLAMMSAMAVGLAGPALADSTVVLRVISVKTDDVTAYVHELDKGRQIIKRLGLSVQTRAWRATFAGPNAGTIIVSQEFASMMACADAMTKTGADPEYTQWIKNLDKMRTIVSDSLYREL